MLPRQYRAAYYAIDVPDVIRSFAYLPLRLRAPYLKSAEHTVKRCFRVSPACIRSFGLNTTMQFIESNRGGALLIHNDHRYRRKRCVNDAEYWKCMECSSTMVTECRQIKKAGKPHDHPPRRDEATNNILRSNLKRRAVEEPNKSVQEVYETEVGALADNVAVGILPTFDQVRSSMYRKRRSVIPDLPQRREDIQIPPAYATLNNENFLLVDEGEENRLLMFSTRKNLTILCRCDAVYGDGTFHSSPLLFTQIYTLHGMFNGTMLPLVYALLPSKNETDYTRMLNALDIILAQMGLVLNPQSVVLDYELAVHNAWRTVRPGVQLKGCMFHFGQCVWRKLQSLGLQQAYAEDLQFQAWARLILALPLLPTYEVEAFWMVIEQQAPVQQYPASRDLCEYFSRFWIDDNTATFAIPIWNHFATDGPRTTNHVKGKPSQPHCTTHYVN